MEVELEIADEENEIHDMQILCFSGKYSFDELHRNGEKNFSEYGKIVGERMLPGVNLVHLFDPDDIAEVFRQDGPGNYPSRKSHLALAKYRRDRPNIYNTAGLLPS
jgi:ecdysteroid 22-hydroxylase